MTTAALTIRPARQSDLSSLELLAQLDSRRRLAGEVLLALSGDRPVAAVAVADGRATADPFLPTAPAVELLRHRAQQLRAGSVGRREHARLIPADAAATGGHP
jgi:hypothetical protein